MSTKFASGQNALAECDVCGFQYRLRQLNNLVVRGDVTEIKACPECWEPDHPQNMLGEFPVYDPQAIRNPRPDFAGYAQSRALLFPVTPVVGTTFIGEVTIQIT